MNKNLKNNDFKILEISRNELHTKKKDKIFYVECILDDIPDQFFANLTAENRFVHFIDFVPVSEFPSSTRDFSFSITNLLVVNDVINLLNDISDTIIKDAFIFDFYKNEKMASVKLGYRFIFQSKDKTLSDQEINKKVNEILNPILQLDGVSIPGM